MILLGNTFIAIATILSALIRFVIILLIARVVISWLDASPYNTLVRIINQSTEPIYRLFGKWRLVYGSIDFTLIVVLLALEFIDQAFLTSLASYGRLMTIEAAVPHP